MKVLRRIEYRRRGKASWMTVTWPDGSTVEQLLDCTVPPRIDHVVQVFVARDGKVGVLTNDEADRAWAARDT